jgi:choline monooxygenase
MDYSVDPDIGKAWTLPADFFLSQRAWEYSKDRIFAPSWQLIADAESVRVPGQICPLTFLEGFLDEPILITRDMRDELHCISNVCTHRANIVAEAPGNERFLRCRYHGRRFSLDGTFEHMPEFEGVENFPCASDNLAKLPFGVWENLAFASLSPEMPLEEYLKPMIDRIGWMPIRNFVRDDARATEYLVRAHWALYCDNYLEGFHIPFIHAGLNEAIDYGNYTTELFPAGVLQLAPAKGGEAVFDIPADAVDSGRAISAYYFWLFPNTMLNFYPWGLSVNIVRPIAPDLTKVTFIPCVWDETKRDLGAGAALDRVEREDEAVVELVQKGIRSRFYDRGRYSPARETGTHHFHRMIAERMK